MLVVGADTVLVVLRNFLTGGYCMESHNLHL